MTRQVMRGMVAAALALLLSGCLDDTPPTSPAPRECDLTADSLCTVGAMP